MAVRSTNIHRGFKIDWAVDWTGFINISNIILAQIRRQIIDMRATGTLITPQIQDQLFAPCEDRVIDPVVPILPSSNVDEQRAEGVQGIDFHCKSVSV